MIIYHSFKYVFETNKVQSFVFFQVDEKGRELMPINTLKNFFKASNFGYRDIFKALYAFSTDL